MQCPPNCAAKQIVPFESRVPTLLSQEQIFVVFLLWRMYESNSPLHLILPIKYTRFLSMVQSNQALVSFYQLT